MKLSVTAAAVSACVLLLSATHLHAADGTVRTMVRIVLDFRHIPTNAQKATLQGILVDPTTTAAERVLAETLMNVEHVASPDDQPRLKALIRDKSAPSAVKTLAIVLEHF